MTNLAVDATSIGFVQAGVGITISHTCAAGAVLYVAISGLTGAFGGTATVKYNGVDLTRRVGGTINTNREASIWSLDTPDSGTHNIVIVCGAGSYLTAVGVSFTGAETQFGSSSATISSLGSGTSVTVPLTTNWDNSFIINAAYLESNTAITVSSPQVEDGARTDAVGNYAASCSHRPTGYKGSFDMIDSSAASSNWGTVLCEVRAHYINTTDNLFEIGG